jgi:hypothetical protein
MCTEDSRLRSGSAFSSRALTLYGSAFKIRDPGAADRQDARSRLVVTHVVTGTDSGT